MYLLIGADLVPTKSNFELFKNGEAIDLVGNELKNLLDSASYRIFNLEVPLTDKESPIMKCGPNLIAPSCTVEGYKALGVDLLTLANNHILDQGESGLRSTTNTLQNAGISYLGVGDNILMASKPYYFSFYEKRIGVYACVEHEFSVAEENKPGANPFDPLWTLDHIEELKRHSDFVIVLYHGGKEHYRYPSPSLQKTCRRFVDKGANLVICQHSHCIGCEEKYENGTIVYGQGNFLFDLSDELYWQTSILVKLDEDFSISYIPIVKTGNGVRLADNKKAEEILQDFFTRSHEIKNPEFITRQYKDFADSFLDYYLRAISGKRSIFFRIINKLSGGSYMRRFLEKTYGLNTIIRISNYIDCEAHRELLSQALANVYNSK